MFTAIIFDGLKPNLWSHGEPFIYDLEMAGKVKVYETGKGDMFFSTLDNIFNSIKKHTENFAGQIRIIFVIDTKITLVNPVKNYLAKRIDFFEDVLDTIGVVNPYELNYFVFDSIERDKDGEPKNENAKIAWDMDFLGYINEEDILKEKPVFLYADFKMMDEHWKSMLVAEGIESGSEELLVNELKERQNVIDDKADSIIKDTIKLFDVIVKRIVNNKLKEIGKEETRLLKLKISDNHETVNLEKIREYFEQHYVKMRESFASYLNEFKVGNIKIEPSLKLKQLLRYEVSLVSKCYERRIGWLKVQNDQAGYLKSVLKFIFIMRTIINGNDSFIIRGKVNYCDIEVNIEELRSFLEEYLCVLKSTERYVDNYKINAGKIKIEPCPIFFDGFSTERQINSVIDFSPNSICGKNYNENFKHCFFFSHNDFHNWSEYLDKLEKEFYIASKLASVEKARIKKTSNLVLDNSIQEEKECDFQELQNYMNILNEKILECQIRVKKIKHSPTNLKEDYFNLVQHGGEVVKNKLEKKIGYKAFLLSILVAAIGSALFYTFIQVSKDTNGIYSFLWYIQIVVMFTAIEGFIIISKNKNIDQDVKALTIEKEKAIRRKENELKLFSEYLGLVSIIKMCKKYLSMYQQEIDIRFEMANIIQYHKDGLTKHISFCEKFLEAYNIKDSDEKYRIYNIGIDFADVKDVKRERLYSPFICSKSNEVYEVYEKGIIYKGENKKRSLGEIYCTRG